MSIISEDTNTKIANLKETIEGIAIREQFLSYKCDIQKVEIKGVNYLGELFKVDIKGETVLGEKQVNIVVKSKVTDTTNIQVISINDIYSRELYSYKELSDIYRQLQEDANVPFEERYKFIKCYDESNTDTIIMEDMAKLGYVNYNRVEVISIDFAEKCIRKLAKFHALSFVLEKEKLDYFNCNIKLLKYPFIYNEHYVKFVKNMYEISLNHLEGEYKAKLESVGDLCEKYYNFVNNTSVIRCLCHGDYRVMNIMMKCTEGESDVIPLDYQFVHYGSPVLDILYFIFASTDRKFRKKHLESLKNLYHGTMEDFLKYFNMDINLYYPRKEFDKAYEDSLEFGIIISLLYLPLFLADEDEVLDNRKNSVSNVNFSVNERVKTRLEDVINDCIEWDIFKRTIVSDTKIV